MRLINLARGAVLTLICAGIVRIFASGAVYHTKIIVFPNTIPSPLFFLICRILTYVIFGAIAGELICCGEAYKRIISYKAALFLILMLIFVSVRYPLLVIACAPFLSLVSVIAATAFGICALVCLMRINFIFTVLMIGQIIQFIYVFYITVIVLLIN